MRRNEKPQWENYKKMIHMKAWHYSRSSGIEHDELISEGNLIFVKACRYFDGKRGKFSTFLWMCLDNGLRSFISRERRQMFFEHNEDGLLPDGRCDDHKKTQATIFVQQSVNCLPPFGRAALQLYINNPPALGLNGSEPPRKVRGALKRYIHEQGASWSVTWQAMREIKNIFQEA